MKTTKNLNKGGTSVILLSEESYKKNKMGMDLVAFVKNVDSKGYMYNDPSYFYNAMFYVYDFCNKSREAVFIHEFNKDIFIDVNRNICYCMDMRMEYFE